MSIARDTYIRDLYLLSRVNLDNWNRFIEAYRVYTLEHIEQMLGSPTSELHVSVGRARQALIILNEMQTIDELYNKIEKKK